MTPQTRSRLVLLLIAALFLGSFAAAALLRFSGWEPAHTRNYGELLDPPLDLRELSLRAADGTAYPWQPAQRVWRIAVVPPEHCTAVCADLLDALRRIWLSEGRFAGRLHVLWFGEPPAAGAPFAALRAMRPDAALRRRLPAEPAGEGVPVYLIDPSGFLVLRYRAGFDPRGLRKDLGRLLK